MESENDLTIEQQINVLLTRWLLRMEALHQIDLKRNGAHFVAECPELNKFINQKIIDAQERSGGNVR